MKSDLAGDIFPLRLAALADPRRLAILRLMARGTIGTCCDRIEGYENACCVTDVVQALGLSQPTVSHHLKVLEQAGLVRREVRGPWTCYFPRPEAVRELAEWLVAELAAPAERGARAGGPAPADCPVPAEQAEELP